MKKKEYKNNLEDLNCPLCQGDEYIVSTDGEKFTCASCGFHTKNFSSIQCLHQTPLIQTKFKHIHTLSKVCH
ncbi:hypothetical protein DA096_23175 [Vibrio rotiferianus]|uniref:Uncharacterized protein n=1 Tax=Vibrio rotiferianus TaxID=190895 RepID=A0A7Y3Z9C8_9VIBR|nr:MULTISPECIES: hypothetical protein [Vibrio]ASI95064.1 hypothetical protein BSZ04_08650 [Vibrio rotiferianus]NOH48917.1 hypothetical protein [Vibrio rotiferianus]NOH68566.1 hypothetical protein [Vibrio rotiferianus]TMX31410.1 hypothetical protein DA095_25420 [Vibrio rotiferianus]TMX42989.1 hypothetical protein DA093_22925 [Vibrio rotiferianus]